MIVEKCGALIRGHMLELFLSLNSLLFEFRGATVPRSERRSFVRGVTGAQLFRGVIGAQLFREVTGSQLFRGMKGAQLFRGRQALTLFRVVISR